MQHHAYYAFNTHYCLRRPLFVVRRRPSSGRRRRPDLLPTSVDVPCTIITSSPMSSRHPDNELDTILVCRRRMRRRGA